MINQEKEKIFIEIKNEFQIEKNYICEINISLESCIKVFAKFIKKDYLSLIVLYNGGRLFGDDLKKPISEIINQLDTKDKKMTLLVYQNPDFDIKDLEKIIIILSIETVKIKKLEGQKGDG